MEDPAYADGVKSDSVCEMIEDIYSCMVGKGMFIKLPVPVKHLPPSTHMHYRSDTDYHDLDISPISKRHSKSSSTNASIASRVRHSIGPPSGNGMAVAYEETQDPLVAQVQEAIDEILTRSNSRMSTASISSESRTVISDTDSTPGDDDEVQDMEEECGIDTPPALMRYDSVAGPSFSAHPRYYSMRTRVPATRT